MQRFGIGSRVAAVALVVAAFVLTACTASAHEERQLANGKYAIEVGFLNEPAVTGQWNALYFQVVDTTQPAPTPAAGAGDGEDALAGAPVDGLDETLQAEIIFGDKKKTLTLEPLFGHPGAYIGYVIPTAAGDYSFHIFGTINGDAIDETFTSSPQGFDSVQDAANFQFP